VPNNQNSVYDRDSKNYKDSKGVPHKVDKFIGKEFRKGFLLYLIAQNQLESKDVQPTIDELQMFKPNNDRMNTRGEDLTSDSEEDNENGDEMY
jgi:transcription elongation factor